MLSWLEEQISVGVRGAVMIGLVDVFVFRLMVYRDHERVHGLMILIPWQTAHVNSLPARLFCLADYHFCVTFASVSDCGFVPQHVSGPRKARGIMHFTIFGSSLQLNSVLVTCVPERILASST